MKTFGEAWYEVKQDNMDENKKFHNARQLSEIQHTKRMSREEANEYYRAKSRQHFGIEVFSRKDFSSLEEYFDYYEALKFKKQLGIA